MLYIIYSWLFLDHKKSFIYNIGYYKSYFHILFLTVNVLFWKYIDSWNYYISFQYTFTKERENWKSKYIFVNIIIIEPYKNIFRVVQFAKSCYDTLVLELITTFLPSSSLSIIFISRGFIIQSTIYIIFIDIYHICSFNSTHLRGLLKVNPLHCYSGDPGGFNFSCWVVDTLS